MKIEKIEKVELVLTLTDVEATYLAAVLQNSHEEKESDYNRDIRHAIFNGLSEVLNK